MQKDHKGQIYILFASTLAFTICFAVWTIFSIIGLQIKDELGLNETQFGLLIATPILTGSLSRLFLGIWTDQYGGRVVYTLLMVTTAGATWLLTHATSYPMLLLSALGVGLAGGSFAVGITYVSKWFSREKQGTALGLFGMGNVGAAVTSFGAPFLLILMGGSWQGVVKIYSVVLLLTAIVFWFTTKDSPALLSLKKSRQKSPGLLKQMQPLKNVQVWRFSLYYTFVFGAFVALVLWLPHYYINVYGLDLKTAGLFTACFALPGSLFRAFGGWLSDKYGARKVMSWTFAVSSVCTFLMSYPSTDYIVHGIDGEIKFNISMGLLPFVSLTVILGFFMSLGKAAVYKHIPVYYPNHVGSVGGVVGLVGGLGGFFLPIAFGILDDYITVWTSCFMLLFVLVSLAFIWMHLAVIKLERQQFPALAGPKSLPGLGSNE